MKKIKMLTVSCTYYSSKKLLQKKHRIHFNYIKYI